MSAGAAAVRLAGLAALLLHGGCATWLSGERAHPTSGGIRYALPQPMIKVVPQADGSVSVETIYVPDPRETYLIRTGSLLAKYTLDVQTDERGLLKSVVFNPDASTVAAEAARATGEVAKARLEAVKAARDKEVTAAEKTSAELRDAGLALATADAKLLVLQEQLAAARAADNAALVTELEQQRRAAEIAQAEAKAKLDRLAGLAASGGSFSRPATEGSNQEWAYGPVLFVVQQANTRDTDGDGHVDDYPIVVLKPLAPQRAFDSSRFAQPGAAAGAQGDALKLKLPSDKPIARSGAGFPEVTLSVVGGTIDEALGAELRPILNPQPLDQLKPEVKRSSPSHVVLRLHPQTPAGAYLLVCRLLRTGGTEETANVRLKVL